MPAADQASKILALKPDDLRRSCDPSQFDFATTSELEALDRLPGQERALDALDFAAGMDHPGYNLFVLGPKGTGRHMSVKLFLESIASQADAPSDWVYVYCFKSAHHPQAIELPPRTANRFRDAVDTMIDDLKTAIPEIFNTDDYRTQRSAIDSDFNEKQEAAFEALSKKAQAQDVMILRSPMGFALVPSKDGAVLKPDEFNALEEGVREAFQKKIEELQTELAKTLEHIPVLHLEHREEVKRLDAEFTSRAVDVAIRKVSKSTGGLPAIESRMKEVREDLITNSQLFLQEETVPGAPAVPISIGGDDQRFNRYRINVIVANDGDGNSKGVPIVFEDHPTLPKLVGRIEHRAQFGALLTDFTMIRAGALHEANGGYLVLEARKLLSEPFAWEALKRALRAEAIKIVSAADEIGMTSTISLEPDPIPLKLKVVLIGERLLYYLLSALDPDFGELFRIEADFEEEYERNEETVTLYAQLLSSIAKQEDLLPLDPEGVARMIEEAVRMSQDAERISLKIGEVSDLLQQSSYWSARSGKTIIDADDIEKAVSEQRRRTDRMREKSLEAITRDTILIDTDGDAVGQVNGLSVLQIGKTAFGKPSRITVQVRNGSGKVIDIERETKLGGPIHSKGVLILSGYLAANYSLDTPMSLWASIVFEQSYGGVDGDSASCAELCALLSSLSRVPIKQSLAITGSVNQRGVIQAIGGVNEKIEGFFDICKERGLSGDQGVIIPASNTKHLMLRSDVVDAVKNGSFAVYAVTNVEQAIELLTGQSAGERKENGQYPENTINWCVEERLREFAETRRRFGETEEAQNSGKREESKP